MTIDAETLMAYADGEADPLTAKRVERAMAADPALAAEVARHRALTARLRGAFAAVDAAPMPGRIEAMVREGAAVVPLARAAPSPAPWPGRRWLPAVAAALVAGLALGQFVPRGEGELASRDGVTIASGALGKALGTQLAATQAADAPVRIGLTFRDPGGALCRTFEEARRAGIACAGPEGWRIERLDAVAGERAGAYRQAGAPAIMAAAQAMMTGEPLDAAQERTALAGVR